jgi:hypothetical protein
MFFVLTFVVVTSLFSDSFSFNTSFLGRQRANCRPTKVLVVGILTKAKWFSHVRDVLIVITADDEGYKHAHK